LEFRRVLFRSITIVSPVVSNTKLSLVRNQDYNIAEGMQIDFAIASPDLTGATILLIIYLGTVKTPALIVAGAVVNPGLTDQLIRFQPASADTAKLTDPLYRFLVWVTYPS